MGRKTERDLPRPAAVATDRASLLAILHVLRLSERELDRLGLPLAMARSKALRDLIAAEYRWEEAAHPPRLPVASNDP